MLITPAILAHNEQEFRDRMFFAHQLPEGRWHIDVLDGSLYNATCWHDANIVGDIPDLPEIELHLMVHDPFAEVLVWHRAVPSLRRVLLDVHAPHLSQILSQMRAMKLDASLVLNPGVLPDLCSPFHRDVDEIVIMGVHPGASGQAFLGDDVFARILRTRVLFPHIDIAVDGGIQRETIGHLAQAGVMRVITASALWKSASPRDAHQELQELAKVVL